MLIWKIEIGKLSKNLIYISSNFHNLIWHKVSWNCTMWKFSNFPATLILRDINFGWFQKVKNCHFNKFEGFEYWFLEKFHIWKCQKFPKIQTSEVLKWAKWQFLGYKMTNYWFHVKSDMQKNHEISTLCILNYAAQVCMDRLKIIEAGKSRWFCDVIPMPQHTLASSHKV